MCDKRIKGTVTQIIKFGIVGISNTLISYVIYSILVYCNVYYLLASVIGFVVSVVNSYIWNSKYVFNVSKNSITETIKMFIKTFLSYAGTGLVLSNILLVIWVDFLNVNEYVAPLVNLVVTIPLNFLLNKYWAFKKRR